jgi:hypothetical protein
MVKPTDPNRIRSRAGARPGKSVPVIILILAAVAAGGAYAWRSGMIRSPKPAPDPTPGATTPKARGGAPQAPPGRSPSTGGGPRAPTSIFDDTGGSPTPQVTPPAPRPSTPTAAPAPLPAAPPPPDPAALETAARHAERSLVRAREVAVARLRSSPTFATRQAEVDRLEAALKQARASGTPQERLDASAAWNTARLALDKDYDAVLAADPAYAAASAAARRAADALKAARPAGPARK